MDAWQNTLLYMFSMRVEDRVTPERKLAMLLNSGFGYNIDRTKTVADQSTFIVCTPIPINTQSIELNDALVNSANAILAYNRPIYLLWSGGIDSTTALYALIDTGVQFTVIMDSCTVAEYPYLADRLLSGTEPRISVMCSTIHARINLNQFVLENPNALFVTGELGDQTFGSDTLFRFTYNERSLPIKEAVTNGILDKDIYEYCKNSTASLLGVEAAYMTVAEFLWSLNFIFKYQTVQLRTAVFRLKSQGEHKNCVHFFDTEMFNMYALNNYKSNVAFELHAEYKMPLKNYIFSQNGDVVYRDTKLKEASLRASNYFGFSR